LRDLVDVVGADVFEDAEEVLVLARELVEVLEQIDDHVEAEQADQADEVGLEVAADHLAVDDLDHAMPPRGHPSEPEASEKNGRSHFAHASGSDYSPWCARAVGDAKCR